MFNATNRLIALMLAAASLASCGDGDRKAAQALADEAAASVDAGNYTEALATLDTLDIRFRAQTDVRRAAMLTRQRAIEAITIDSIKSCDARLAEARLTYGELQPQMVYNEGAAGLEGYYTAAKGALGHNDIQARVDNDGYFILAVSVGKAIDIRSIELSADGLMASSSALQPDRVVSVEGQQVASFSQEEVDNMMNALSDYGDKAVSCTVRGLRGDVKFNLKAPQTAALIKAWKFALASQNLRMMQIKREKLERRLATTRDHIANLIPDPQAN